MLPLSWSALVRRTLNSFAQFGPIFAGRGRHIDRRHHLAHQHHHVAGHAFQFGRKAALQLKIQIHTGGIESAKPRCPGRHAIGELIISLLLLTEAG